MMSMALNKLENSAVDIYLLLHVDGGKRGAKAGIIHLHAVIK